MPPANSSPPQLVSSNETLAREIAAAVDWEVLGSEALLVGEIACMKVTVRFSFRHIDRSVQHADAKLYLPLELLDDPSSQWPLTYFAGYEVDDLTAAVALARRSVVVTPLYPEEGSLWPASNPLARGPNLDIALLHLARSGPFIDDTRVVITGGSAGGYTTLMLAAETFPLAGIAPAFPPFNWSYNAAYFLRNDPIATIEIDGAPAITALAGVREIFIKAAEVYGHDTDSAIFREHSPLHHLDKITCSVSMVFSTADLLVPVDQFSEELVRARAQGEFPAGYETDPRKLSSEDSFARRRVLDELPKDETDVQLIPVPPTAKKVAADAPWDLDTPTVPMPSSSSRWAIGVIDEGPPERDVGHMRHGFLIDQSDFFRTCFTSGQVRDRLTSTKLIAMLDRYRGNEWMSSELPHLDDPDAERRDVMRGLRTFSRTDPEAMRLLEVYRQLPSADQVIGDLARASDAGGVRKALES